MARNASMMAGLPAGGQMDRAFGLSALACRLVCALSMAVAVAVALAFAVSPPASAYDRGIAKDEAVRWYPKSADQRHARGRTTLAQLQGQGGQAEGADRRLARLTVGIVPADALTPIVDDGVNVRAFPEPDAEVVRQLAKGRQVRVTGVLASGWLRIAEAGEAVGWIFKTAVAPAALAEGVRDEDWFLPLRSSLATSPAPAARQPATTPAR